MANHFSFHFNRLFLPFIFSLGLISCQPSTEKLSTELKDYFGQTYPDATPIIFAPDIVSIKGRLEHGISFTPEMREMAFGILSKEDYNGTIYYSKKSHSNWTKPTIFEPLKNESVYLPYFSPNGKSLLYAQSKPDTTNGFTNIWIMEKDKGNWGTPEKLPTPLNSNSREANAGMTKNGTIYFSSNRNCEGKENCYTADLFSAELNNHQYQNVNLIPEFVSPNDEESVFISPNEDYLIFCRYTDNETLMDLNVSYRDHKNNWLAPQLLDASINSKDMDRRPFVSIDNKFLFFTRLQPGEAGLSESDIYWVNTSKLFKPFVYRPLLDIVVQTEEKFEILLPEDYFKDIDDKELRISMNQAEMDWIAFDREQMKLSGLPTMEGNFELIFTAKDKFSNRTKDKIKITVRK